MSFKRQIVQHIEENIALKHQVLQTCVDPIEKCVDHFANTLKNEGKILFCGNGGSAADSQHLAAELVVRLRGTYDRPALPAIALTVNTSVLTAAGNDYGFDQIFARQIEALGNSGDILVAISTSGSSKNIVEAVKSAKDRKLMVVGFLGGSGGKIAPLVDLPIIVPSKITTRIQEAHILIGHIICELVETELQKAK